MRTRVNAAAFLFVIGVASVGHADLRVATFNTSLSRNNEGALIAALAGTGDSQAQATAEVLQIVRPDVVLLNEFDYDAGGQAVSLFQQNYLGVGQNGQAAINYPYVYLAPSNTGVQPEDELGSGFDFDFNNNSSSDFPRFDDPEDAFGFGRHPGHFGMVLLSQHPIDTDGVRTFREFLWKDMPGALLPDSNPFVNPGAQDWYSEEELDVFRLSSKSHWDVPIEVDGETIHILASHPTPPVFDGQEDRNGRRNHDEIRFWADYVTDGNGNDYIYDDLGGVGGLDESSPGASFIVLGDQNADPDEGDSVPGAIDQLLDNPLVNDTVPIGDGGPRPDDTATFLGGVRVDYALPSSDLRVLDSGVFWPTGGDPGAAAVGFSDHRLVFVDVATGPAPIVPEPTMLLVWGGLLGVASAARRFPQK